MRRTPLIEPPGADYHIRVVGDRRTPVRDFYHALLRLPWWVTFASIAASFVALNLVFAFGFLLTGGIANARPGSLADAFFFSVQTSGTIGYGAFAPTSTAANVLVVAEAIASLILTALATGLVFTKFSRSTARVVFTREAVISPLSGVPTLMFRLGNERGNQIVNADVRVTLTRTEQTAEGVTLYRVYDLALARERLLSLSRAWTVYHPIDRDSPMYGLTPEMAREQGVEVEVLLVGLDDISMQTVHASRTYFVDQVVWGARHADVLSEGPDGDVIIDLQKFHDLEPTAPTEDFPFPRTQRPPAE